MGSNFRGGGQKKLGVKFILFLGSKKIGGPKKMRSNFFILGPKKGVQLFYFLGGGGSKQSTPVVHFFIFVVQKNWGSNDLIFGVSFFIFFLWGSKKLGSNFLSFVWVQK